jgi:hypothetical protein
MSPDPMCKDCELVVKKIGNPSAKSSNKRLGALLTEYQDVARKFSRYLAFVVKQLSSQSSSRISVRALLLGDRIDTVGLERVSKGVHL